MMMRFTDLLWNSLDSLCQVDVNNYEYLNLKWAPLVYCSSSLTICLVLIQFMWMSLWTKWKFWDTKMFNFYSNLIRNEIRQTNRRGSSCWSAASRARNETEMSGRWQFWSSELKQCRRIDWLHHRFHRSRVIVPASISMIGIRFK